MRTNMHSSSVKKQDQVKTELAKLLESVCSPGYFGTASITVNVQDGHIQYSRVLVDRMVR